MIADGTAAAALRRLEELGVRVWLAGGWAEELRGLVPPRPHADVDVLLPAATFGVLDGAFAAGRLDEIAAKRFHHKRAFDLDGVMVEAVLLEPTASGHVTRFWNAMTLTWPGDTLGEADGLRVASEAALREYRRWHPRLDSLRRRMLGAAA